MGAGGRRKKENRLRIRKPGAIIKAVQSPAVRARGARGASGRRIEKKNGLVII